MIISLSVIKRGYPNAVTILETWRRTWGGGGGGIDLIWLQGLLPIAPMLKLEPGI